MIRDKINKSNRIHVGSFTTEYVRIQYVYIVQINSLTIREIEQVVSDLILNLITATYSCATLLTSWASLLQSDALAWT